LAAVFDPVRTRRTFEEAVEQVADRVRLGELRTGDRLPSERDLAKLMQISRPTVREAVKVLADAGVVEVKPGPGGGIFVASDVAPASLLARGSGERVDGIAVVLQARRAIEPQVAVLAAVNGSEDDFEAMARTIERQRALLDDGGVLVHEDAFLGLERQFHLTLARASANPRLARIMRSLIRDLEIARDMAMHVPLVADWTLEIHARTLLAVRAGDRHLIEDVMDEHLGRMEETWASEIRPGQPAGSITA
jgi:GntR family transcriptional repressor for pyruvate dehydrogenase complex